MRRGDGSRAELEAASARLLAGVAAAIIVGEVAVASSLLRHALTRTAGAPPALQGLADLELVQVALGVRNLAG